MTHLVTKRLADFSVEQVAALLNLAFETGNDGDLQWSALIEREVESRRADLNISAGVVDGEELVGVCLLNPGWSGQARVGSTGAHPQRRRQGIGRLLVSRSLANLAETGAKQVVLEVDPDNNAAIKLYKEFGFVDWRGLTTWVVRRSELQPVLGDPVLSMDVELAIQVAHSFARSQPAFQRSAPYVSSFTEGVRALGVQVDSHWVGVLVQRGRDLLELSVHPEHHHVLGALIWAASELSWELRLMHQVDEDPLCEVLTQVGFRIDSKAREMVKERL
jgi:ribosomal protein S18 acetylase RimI-like enzyme